MGIKDLFFYGNIIPIWWIFQPWAMRMAMLGQRIKTWIPAIPSRFLDLSSIKLISFPKTVNIINISGEVL